MALSEQRIAMNEKEGAAVSKLLDSQPMVGALTRAEPGETGAIIVTVGDRQWLVAEDGKTREVKG